MKREESRTRRIILGCGVVAAALWLGILLVWPPDTYEDMIRALDSVPVPQGFTLVSREFGGLRSGFMAAQVPHYTRDYRSAPPTLKCKDIQAFYADFDPKVVDERGFCGVSFRVSSGLLAKAVNVWGYSVSALIVGRERLREVTPERCAEVRALLREMKKPGSLPSYPECWIDDDDVVLRVSVRSKQGF